MIGYIILSVFVLIILLFVYYQYRNEKKYQEERQLDRRKSPVAEKKPSPLPPRNKNIKKEPVVEQETRKTPTVESPTIIEEIVEETVEVTEEPKNIAITLADYPKFDNSRLLDMGLSQDEANDFVKELIPQIGAQIPLIREALESSDFDTLERLTHSIKGSSTTVGTGGVADLISDFNTYLKSGAELSIAEAYIEQLNHYYEELKKQYA